MEHNQKSKIKNQKFFDDTEYYTRHIVEKELIEQGEEMYPEDLFTDERYDDSYNTEDLYD